MRRIAMVVLVTGLAGCRLGASIRTRRAALPKGRRAGKSLQLSHRLYAGLHRGRELCRSDDRWRRRSASGNITMRRIVHINRLFRAGRFDELEQLLARYLDQVAGARTGPTAPQPASGRTTGPK